MKTSRLFTIVLALLTLAGCSEIIEPKPLTYTQLLTGAEKKTWTLTSYEVIDDGEASGPIPASQLFNNTCEADDQFVFYANAERKYEYVNGPTKCATSEPEVLLEDTWSFINATATLEFVFPIFGNVKYPYIVKSLTENKMIIELYLDELDNVNASYRFVLSSSSSK
jgi:hypothetical protein